MITYFKIKNKMKIIKYLFNKKDNIKIKYDLKIIIFKIIYIINLYLIYISKSPKKRVGVITVLLNFYIN